MGLRLNMIDDDAAARSLSKERPRLERLEAQAGAENARQQRHLGDQWFQVGALLYQQGGSLDDIRSALSSAGSARLRSYELLSEPAAMETRNPWSFLRSAGLVVAFGDERMRERLAQVRPIHFWLPPSEGTRAVALAAEAVQALIRGDRSGVPVTAAISALTMDVTPDHAKRTLSPLVSGLRAILHGDVAVFRAALAEVVRVHEYEALHGDYTLSADGLLSVDALMLEKLGRERGWSSGVTSPYLPVALLEPGGG